jgi:hypothetical protein
MSEFEHSSDPRTLGARSGEAARGPSEELEWLSDINLRPSTAMPGTVI